MNSSLRDFLQNIKLGEYVSLEVSAEIDQNLSETYPGACFRIEALEVELLSENADSLIDGKYKLFLKSPDESTVDKVIWLWRRVR